MNNDFNIVNAADIISAVTDFSKRNDNEIVSVWKKIVSKIGYQEGVIDSKNSLIGKRLAANTHVVDLKNGVLLIETNHSGWIQYLRMYQNFILKGLKWNLPNLKISNLAFRVRGTEASLSDIYDNQFEKAQSKMNEKMDEQEKELEKRFGENKGQSQKENKNSEKLPDDLFKRLENLKKSM